MKKHKGKILVLFLVVLLVSFMSCENSFLKKMLVEEEKGKTVPEKPHAPFIEGGASLILSPNKLNIKVKVTTADNSSVRIEGCTETELTSGAETVLHAIGTTVILKGNIIKLYCGSNQLTALNVQGLTALERLDCYGNRLTADAFKKLFDDLPVRAEGNNTKCILYTERTGVTEGNHTDFSAPPDLADAFNNAKNNKKWKMYKWNGSWPEVEI